MRIIVVLPAPLGPRKPKALPRGTHRSTPSIAARAPKRLVTPCVSIAAGPTPGWGNRRCQLASARSLPLFEGMIRRPAAAASIASPAGLTCASLTDQRKRIVRRRDECLTGQVAAAPAGSERGGRYDAGGNRYPSSCACSSRTRSSSCEVTPGSRSVVTSPERAALGDVAQQPAHDLARARLGQVVGPDDPLGAGELADPLGDRRADALDLELVAVPSTVALQRHERDDRLPGVLVVLADHRGLGHVGVGDDRRLDLRGGEAVPGDVDDVVDAPDHPEVAVGVAARGVADEVGLLAEALEVGLDVALLLLVERAQHRRPRAASARAGPGRARSA